MPLYNPPIAPWQIVQEGMAAQGASHTLTANQVYLWTFEVQATTIISSLRWKMAATTTGTTDLGIYDSNGNRLDHTGATANVANTTQTASLSNGNLSLPPGRYAMALCPSNSTDTYSDNATAGSSLCRAMGCANGGTAGFLPAVAGAFAVAGNAPVMEAVVVGGAP